MKELGERARLLLRRYKTVESLSPAHEERLLARLEDAIARGTSPRFDDEMAAPIAVPMNWFQRAWSVPLLRPLIVVLLMAVPAVAAVGIASRLTPAPEVPLPPRTAPAPISAQAPRPAGEAPASAISPLETAPPPVVPRQPAPRPATRSASPRIDATIDGEMRLLKDAQAAGADGNWQRALRLLDEYAVRYPAGRLADVRAVAHLTALCKVGQMALARSEAERFLVRYPNSPFTDRVKRVCAVTADP